MITENSPGNGDALVDTFGDERASSSRSLLRVLQERWWIVGLTFLVVSAVGVIYLWQATPIFEATARLYIERREPIVAGAADATSTSLRNYDYLSTQIELMLSDAQLQDAVERGSLTKLRTFEGVEYPVGYLATNLKIDQRERDRQKTQVIEVAIESPFPEDCVQIVDAVVQSYLAFYENTHKKSASAVLQVLDGQRRALAEELRANEDALRTFRKENGVLFSTGEQANLVLGRLTSLEQELAAAQLERIKAETEARMLQELEGRPEDLRAYVLMQGAGDSLSAQSATARREEEVLQETIRLKQLEHATGKVHPRVKSSRLNLEALTQALAESKKDYERRLTERARALVAAAKLRRDSARALESRLEELTASQTELALAGDGIASEHSALVRNVDRTSRAYEVVVDRIGELSLVEDYGTLAIQVVNPPRASEDPVSPQKVRGVAVACLLGLLLGGGLAFLVDLQDSSIRSIDDVEPAVGLPLLGAVPRSKHGREIGAVARWANSHSRSSEAEAFRTIRTAVHFRRSTKEARTFVVTSSNAGEGKTTIAAGLASCFAQNGAKVLLVDADLHNPCQHKSFSVSNAKGLVTHLVGDHEPRDVIVATDVPSLDLIPAGGTPTNPAELLSSESFGHFLEWASNHYDRVVIDSPPVLCVNDAVVLSTRTDSVILVVRVGERTTRRQGAETVNAITSVGGSIAGVVANAFGGRDRSYYYSGYGYKGYPYGGDRNGSDRGTPKARSNGGKAAPAHRSATL